MPKKTVRKAKTPKIGTCKTITRKDGTKQKMCFVGRCKPGRVGVRKAKCSVTGWKFVAMKTRRGR